MVPLTSTELRNEPAAPISDCQELLPRWSGAAALAALELRLGALLADADCVGNSTDDVGDRGLVVETDRVAGTEPTAGHRDLVATAERVGDAESVLQRRSTGCCDP